MSFRRHPFLDGTDIIGMFDNSGNIVVKYTYDAWGNCTITLNTNGIATRNPIRYRGYYYDEDTKLYYLNVATTALLGIDLFRRMIRLILIPKALMDLMLFGWEKNLILEQSL